MQKLYFNGEWRSSQGTEVIEVFDPASETILDQVPLSTQQDVEECVHGATQAFNDWRWVPGYEKAELLHEAASKIELHFDELARLLTFEEGKAISENEEELEWVAGTIRYYAEMARTYRGRLLAPADRSQFNFVLKEPFGPVACIVPFNYPLLLMIWKVAPALAAGNTVIVKPAEQTPLSTLKIAEQVFDHLPAGVFNVLTGGASTGEILVRHPDIRVIAFTGSTRVGKQIAKLAVDTMKHTHLELGGKDAFLLAPDADIESSVQAVAYASLINAGQVCTSTERVYVPNRVLTNFAEAMAEYASALTLGPGIDRSTDISVPHAIPAAAALIKKLYDLG